MSKDRIAAPKGSSRRRFTALSLVILLIAVLMQIFPSQSASAAATPTFVQKSTSASSGGLSTSIINGLAPTTAGNAIIAVVGFVSALPVAFSCKDSRGDVFTNVGVVRHATSGQTLGICYATDIAGGSGFNFITVTFATGVATRQLIGTEYSGIAKTNPVDASSTNWTAVGTTAPNGVTSNAATTTTPGDLIIGSVVDAAGTTTITPGTGFTQRSTMGFNTMALQDRVQVAPGPVASTQKFGTAHGYAANMVAFKPTPPLPAPTAAFTKNASSGSVPFVVNVDASTSHGNGAATITSYAWNFGDGGTITSPTPTAAHTYATGGTYTLSLTVTDSNGQTATASQVVNALAAPTASFSAAPTSGPAPLATTFNANSSVAHGATITNYAWDFGDGGTATGVAASHSFLTSGSWTVTLTVTDSNGQTSTATQVINVT